MASNTGNSESLNSLFDGFDWVGPFDEYRSGWALVSVDGKMGFINEDGKLVVKPQFDQIGPFDEYRSGWALVSVDGKMGFINEDGKVVFDKISF
ncbi:hypothetical protein MASR2M44_07900 [Bacteroidota bacterium]